MKLDAIAASAGTPEAGKTDAKARTDAKAEAETFASTLKKLTKPAADDQVTHVARKHYGTIDEGPHQGLYVNQAGPENPRAGKVFELVERAGRLFHVYSSNLVIEVRASSHAKDEAKTTTPPADGAAKTTSSTAASKTGGAAAG
jgi:hypothetical protein